jgi:uroporphyrinogen III methyltransferase/synthase
VAESLLEAFPVPGAPGERVLLVRAEVGRDALPEGLGKAGHAVDVLPVYRTVRAEPDPAQADRVRRGDVDAVTFTSSSTVTNFRDVVGQLPDGPTVVSIGPVTTRAALDQGLHVTVEAEPHTIDALVEALLSTLGRAGTLGS